MFILFLALTAGATEASVTDVPEATVDVRAPTSIIDASDALRDSLRNRDWSAVITSFRGQSSLTDEEAFLLSWALIHENRAGEAATYTGRLDDIDSFPPEYTALIRARVALASENFTAALAELEQVPEHSVLYPEAVLAVADARHAMGQVDEALKALQVLTSEQGPGPERDEAWLREGRWLKQGSRESYDALRNVWMFYPRTDESIAAYELLKENEQLDGSYAPTWQQIGLRAEQLMLGGEYQVALIETESILEEVRTAGNSIDACRVLYTRGRSNYKKNRLTSSIAAFEDVGTRCAGGDGAHYGAKSMYLKGTAQFRRKQYGAAAATFVELPERYPEHSMADDGYTHAGIALLEKGDLDGAQLAWTEGLERFPNGDTVGEATWRRAWALYLAGRPDDAMDVAKRLAQMDPAVDWVHTSAGRYWLARWSLYPDVNSPNTPVSDTARRQQAIEGWRDLCMDSPHSFYAIMAYSRLLEEAPEVAKQVMADSQARRGLNGRTWTVRLSLLDDPNIQSSIQLSRLGLVSEALAEWSNAKVHPESVDEMAWWTESRIGSGDWLAAHDTFRRWLRGHPVGTHGDGEDAALRVAYPDRYWTEVKAASNSFAYDSRLFHALVREESNFNRQIVSFAGARGLSQLMPATATQTAGNLGMSLSMEQLFEPKTNLKIGSKYYDQVWNMLGSSPYLATGAYNAGPGRMRQWRSEWGNIPTDEFVERVPFRETRGYIKRVMGTWQIYRFQFDVESPAFPDLSAFNKAVLPK